MRLVQNKDIGRLLLSTTRCSVPLPSAPSATLEEAELAFQHMASVSLGYPAGDQALGGTPHEAALLVLVRELMHHLGFVTITAIEDE